MSPDRSVGPPRSFATGAALLALLVSLYLITTTARFRLDDEHIIAARAQSLALRGVADQPQVFGNSRVRALEAQGDQATQIEPLLPALGAVAYRAALWAGIGGAQALFVLGPLLTAATALFVFAAVLVLGFSRRTAIWCAVLFGAGTMAWPYATALVRDTLAATCVACAFLGIAFLARGGASDRLRGIPLLIAGLVLGALAKNTVVAFAVGLALAGMLRGLLRVRTSPSARWTVAGVVLGGLAFVALLAMLPTDGPWARYSLAYYAFLASHFVGSLTPAFLVNTAGPFVSPAKSLFLFSPPAVLAIIALKGADRQTRSIASYAFAGALSLAAAQALFYREQWAGAVGWGLRFMLPALPGLLILAAPAIERGWAARGHWAKAGFLSLFAISGLVQLGGAVVDWNRAYSVWTAQGLDPFQAAAPWNPRLLPLPVQLAALPDPGTWSLLWPRLAAVGSPAWGVPFAALVLAAAGVAVLWKPWGFRSAYAMPGVGGVLLLVSIKLMLVPTLTLATFDPAFGGDRPEFVAAYRLLRNEATADDRVLVDAYGTSLWGYLLNRWDSTAQWTSLPYEIPDPSGETMLSGATLDLLERVEDTPGRIWYISSDDSPDAALQREVRWLDAHDRLDMQTEFSGTGRVTVRLYCNCGS